MWGFVAMVVLFCMDFFDFLHLIKKHLFKLKINVMYFCCASDRRLQSSGEVRDTNQ
jgi:hypothetical protein